MNETPLQRSLQSCSLHALLILVSRTLSRHGFGEVQMLDRRQSREKSRYGGHDLVCFSELGTMPTKVIVKVIKDSARIRMLDELSGAATRVNADLGLLVTPFHITSKAKLELPKYRKPRVEVIDGVALSQLLAQDRIGMREKGEVDYAFFGYLEEASAKMLMFLKKEGLR